MNERPRWQRGLLGLGAVLLILLLSAVVLELAWLLLVKDEAPAPHFDHQVPPGSDIAYLEPISPQEAARILHEQKPHRKLFAFSFLDSWWWRSEPIDAVTSMQEMEGDGKIGGFRSIIKERLLTVPVLVGFVGVALILVGVFLAWRGGKLKGAMIVGGAGVAMVVAGVAFEAYPEITAVLVVLAVLGGAAYALFATSFGRKLLERLGVRDQNFRHVVEGCKSFLERLDKQRFVEDTEANADIIARVKELFFARQGDAQDDADEAEVRAVLNGA